MAETLSRVLNEQTVVALASPISYQRGVVYLEDGRVGPLRTSVDRVGATVHGSEAYSVELRADQGQLVYGCSCPVGLDSAFCKHCVAVGLSWLYEHTESAPTLDDARIYLEGLPHEQLVELLIDHARDDDVLTRKLLLLAIRPEAGKSADVAALSALIDQAFAIPGFVPYREVWGYVRGIEETIDLLDPLLDDGRAGDVIALAEHALVAAERALGHIDDSDGQMRSVIERLEQLHLDACCRGAPDPVALAERLFAWELRGEWDVFYGAVDRYADVLGGTGLARYHDLAAEAWAEIPALEPGSRREPFSHTRFRIARIMESLAAMSGSLAEQIAVRERDLSNGYQYLQIAELCREHNDDDRALDWAQRGLDAFSDAPDPRLRAFLIGEYRRRGQISDALAHSLAAFTERPSLETYRELAADSAAAGDWDERRESAIGLLRSAEPASATSPRRPWSRRDGWSQLVRVLRWEGDLDAAWQAAVEGGCDLALWIELADARRAEHPEDALTVYRRYVDDVIAGKNKRAYKEAVELIDGTMRALFNECGQPQDFDRYLADVRTTHKAKRNLMKLLANVNRADPV